MFEYWNLEVGRDFQRLSSPITYLMLELVLQNPCQGSSVQDSNIWGEWSVAPRLSRFILGELWHWDILTESDSAALSLPFTYPTYNYWGQTTSPPILFPIKVLRIFEHDYQISKAKYAWFLQKCLGCYWFEYLYISGHSWMYPVCAHLSCSTLRVV